MSAMEETSTVEDRSDERIVISGMSGLYPESHSVKELSDILYNKINPVNNKNARWNYKHPEVVQYTGKVPGLMLFDEQFFKVHRRVCDYTDPMYRKLLENSYQAIFDAGMNTEEFNGKKVGVYIGSCLSETEKGCFYTKIPKNGYGLTGCSKSMAANRISYFLNTNGPSVTIDESCCSSIGALKQAYHAIKQGECEAAIVGGANLCLHPQSFTHFGRIMKLSTDGETKSFDTEAAGCARSEVVNVILLQKAKDALRIYAELVHVKCEYTSIAESEKEPKYNFYRDPESMTNFISNFYEEAKVSPGLVEYVEAFGSAAPEVDKVELEAIGKVFCENRNQQLLVGSVMSNIGYGGAASGISAVTKILLGYEHGRLASNLHCESPRKDIAALRDGRMRIVTDHQTFGRTYTAVNGLSVNGITSHVLLHGNYKPKDLSRYKTKLPYLVTVSSRQEVAVKRIFHDLKSRPIDAEEIALLHNIHKARTSSHLGRGFIILDTNEKNETVTLKEKSHYFDDADRPLWFVYSGMGSQWAGMGAQLMRIPVFAAAIERCHRVLDPKGLDIVHIITSRDKSIFDNILHSFVGIAAIQIGLTDVLRALEIFPDKIIGHSVGELGCAYADGCFTTEEMILSAYYRGLVSMQTPFIHGSMAAVGVGFRQMSKMCPPEIEVACHNGPDSSTISGPADIMKDFILKLTAKNIFVKDVSCSNIAYHSRYIADAGPRLLQYLKEIIKSPKARSERWLSTSIPLNKWNEPIAKYSSAEYHVNNLLKPVLFEETSRLIPRNAVLVEIAPNGILQAILKRSLPNTCKHIALTRRGHPDSAKFLLQAIGKLYMAGYNPKLQTLYPKVEFPVSTGTPMLSHLVEWEHSDRWGLSLHVARNRRTAAECTHVISVHDDEHCYLRGHVIRERNTYPFAATLVAVWDTLATILGMPKKTLSVQFSDINLYSQPLLHDCRHLRLSVAIHRSSGRFEVMDDNITVASGFITVAMKGETYQNEEVKFNEEMELKSEDIYQMFTSRNYNYLGEFQSICDANLSLTKAHLLWQNNWVTLIDGMIQINALKSNHTYVSQPIFIRNLQINVENHMPNKALDIQDTICLPTEVSELLDGLQIRCGGILIEDIKFRDLTPVNRNDIVLKTLKFVPHNSTDVIDEITALYVLLQIVAENLNKQEINIIEIIEYRNQSSFDNIQQFISDIPGIKFRWSQICESDITYENLNLLKDIDLLMTHSLTRNDSMCRLLHQVLNPDTFLINKDKWSDSSNTHPSVPYRSVCTHKIDFSRLELIIWRPSESTIATSTFTINSQSDIHKISTQLTTLSPKRRIFILTAYPFAGLKDFVKTLRLQNNHKINLIIINDKLFNKKCINDGPFSDFSTNILEHGMWGGEYYLPVNNEDTTKGQKCPVEMTMELNDIDSLRWIERTLVRHPGVSVKVHFAGLNDAYVKKVIGVATSNMNTHKKVIEYDFSGTTDSNVRVMGVVQEQSIGSHIIAKPELLWPVPNHWTLEDAATVPLAYCLAFYYLCLRNRLYCGDSVLVHGGAGALGQAVISIALAHGCNIYTTVSTEKKKRFLLKLFPQLKEVQIGNSRDRTFVDMVLASTKGTGCNIVISCVKENLRNASAECCSVLGLFVDTTVVLDNQYWTGQDLLTTSALESYTFIKAVTFSAQQFSSIFESRNIEDLKRLQSMMSEGIARGYVRPLSRAVYEPRDAPRALRLQAASRHIGRVLINLQGDIFYTQSKITCSTDRLQLILTDDEDLGVQFAERLISRGARKLELQFKFLKLNSLSFKMRLWDQQGVKYKVSYGRTWNEIENNLSNNKSLENIEGIYCIVATNTENGSLLTCLESLTVLAQRSNWRTRYLVVIDARKDVSEIIKLNQSQEQIQVIRLLSYQIQYGKRGKYFLTNTVDAIEKALCSKHQVVAAHGRNVPYDSLLLELASVADISIPNEISEDVTLKHLGMDITKSQVVQRFLFNEYNILLDQSTIPLLTVKKIQALQDKPSLTSFTDTKDLKTFFTQVDPDELSATTEMTFLPTLARSTMSEEEFDVSKPFICIVPGVEGLHLRFHVLCERLKLPAMVLQPGYERPHETIQELAHRFAKILLAKAPVKNRFYLLGYESGILVALEMAAILEENGLTGTIFCIGGGPEEVQDEFEEKLAEFKTEKSLETAVALHMFSLLINNNNNVDNFEEVLKNATTWKQKLSICVQKLVGSMDHTIQYAEQVIEAAYARVVQVRLYNFKPRVLRSRLISLRPSSASKNAKYPTCLQNCSQEQTFDYELQAPLAYATQDLRCAAIINRHLDDNDLEESENNILSHSYYVNNDSIMFV